ncbi:putative bifunctional UDP-N-acetylglucosamine transferase and deubiquitinase ALG13 isoform X3 [Homarus americanus]|uniref:putative bifunctional UDP-N-acetylglucosamine transferase and deubiquitinase ALG13 isoform X3 n=1 Tax=Homarus americanus TaxID=6706 RepID=UPI001C484E3D|nr:putative bifunctional UDP-N-acetylglucosamine transferase and deubiquitinase ALG13 isoform X3 [Homarus americanus]
MRRRLNSRAFDPFDEWLESQGLYRKQVARDGSCLFRAVAEHVFMSQTEHVHVRSLCLAYMMLYEEDFQPFLEIPIDHHVFKLRDVREWGGHTEIIAMSRLFKVDFLIYQEIGRAPYRATENNFPGSLMLSFTHGNHYDIVYKKEKANIRGFCQSVVYDNLYTHVFQLKDVRLAVDTMLHDKEYASLRRDSTNSTDQKEIGALVEKVLATSISRDNSQDEADKNCSTSIEERPSMEEVHPDDVRGLLAHGIPPFPYKVAKSLDPDIYRNIEFDAWNTVRREARYGPFDSNGFQAGVKVLIKLQLLPNRREIEEMRRVHMYRQGSGEYNDGKCTEERVDVYHGHIQEMSENKGPVDVYVEEIGSRLKVPYESLEKVPSSPPRSPWHAQGQQHIQPSGSGGNSVVGNIPSYKKLTGFYQKAPLPAEPEYPAGRSKKKGGKHMREVMVHNTGMRGRGASSPTPHGYSPRARTPQGSFPTPNFTPKNYPNRGMGRNHNSNFRSAQSPARDGFPSLPIGGNVDMGVEGMWAVRPSTNQSNLPPAPNAMSNPACSRVSGAYCPTIPQPPPMVFQGDEEAHQQMREVTLEALQQVMSAGGQQEVRVTGQQLEVVNSVKREEMQETTPLEENNSHIEHNTSAPQAEDTTIDNAPVNIEDQVGQSQEVNQNNPEKTKITLQVEPLNQSPSLQTTNGEVPPAALYLPDPSITYISPPASITASQMADSSTVQNAAMYMLSYPPPYSSPGFVQVYSPVPPPTDGSGTPTDFTPPLPTTTMPARPEGWDPNVQGNDSEAMKMNQGMPPYMVYQVPVMYGGYGYNYNQQWTYSVPIMPSPGVDDNKQTPVPGEGGFQQVVAIGAWGPGYMGDYGPHQPVPGPPHYNYPPLLREPAHHPYPPPPYHDSRDGNREGPPFPHHYHHHRGRGRGGPHHYSHHPRGSHHNNHQYSNNYQGNNFQDPSTMGIPTGEMGRGGGGQRSLPPRFQRGGGASSGRGLLRPFHNSGPPYQSNNMPHHQRNHQYEGQPLMHMGSRKSSSESLPSQVVSSGNVGSGGLASPPLLTFVESDRPHGVMPLPPQDTPPLPPQDHMPMAVPPGYYPAPPGYVMSGPWMWKMM